MGRPILLGEGVIRIDGVPVGLTRGGSQFMVERTNKEVIADGDFGPVKNRVRKDMSRCSLVLNNLEVIPEELVKMYPATKYTTSTSGGVTTEVFSAKEDIESSDYQDTVEFVGRRMDGAAVVITVENAINLGNIDWTMVDKDEVVQGVTYTGTYLENQRKTEPWDVTVVSSPQSVAATSSIAAVDSTQGVNDLARFTVSPVDQNGGAIFGLSQSDFSFDYGSPAGTVAQEFFSDPNTGVYTFTITDTNAEAIVITATVQGVQLTNTATITFN